MLVSLSSQGDRVFSSQGQGSCSKAELLNRGQPGSTAEQLQEETRREFRSVPPPTHNLLPPSGTHFPQFRHLPVLRSAFESIDELCHLETPSQTHPEVHCPPTPRVLLRSSSQSSLTISGLEPPRRQPVAQRPPWFTLSYALSYVLPFYRWKNKLTNTHVKTHSLLTATSPART